MMSLVSSTMTQIAIALVRRCEHSNFTICISQTATLVIQIAILSSAGACPPPLPSNWVSSNGLLIPAVARGLVPRPFARTTGLRTLHPDRIPASRRSDNLATSRRGPFAPGYGVHTLLFRLGSLLRARNDPRSSPARFDRSHLISKLVAVQGS